jgi:OOP family OmpA-OmpF porin
VKCVISNLSCIRKAEEAGQPVTVVNAQGQAVSSADSARAMSSATKSMATPAPAAPTPAPTPAGPGTEGAEVAVNHDFTPGTRVIWATDFARDPIGDFPRRLKLYEGNFETASFHGQHLLRSTSGGKVIVPLPELLPRQFTLEFDYTGGPGWSMSVAFTDQGEPGWVDFSSYGDAGIHTGDNVGNASSNVGLADQEGRLIHCQVMADGEYVKVYINGKRAAQSPSAKLGRSNQLIFTVTADTDQPAYLGNIRVAAGGKNMYEALETEGRFTTHDILFATGSATLDPRSTSTLTEIGQMLKEHADLKIEIDGHTDNVGNAAANTTLSDQRAASVKQYLIKNFQIGAERLGSRGYGASKPVAPNTTPDGRQQNRRVELVKQ